MKRAQKQPIRPRPPNTMAQRTQKAAVKRVAPTSPQKIIKSTPHVPSVQPTEPTPQPTQPPIKPIPKRTTAKPQARRRKAIRRAAVARRRR